jgi:hypothetical protein
VGGGAFFAPSNVHVTGNVTLFFADMVR